MKNVEVMAKVQQPFPGLRPFQQGEADVFFGRGEQIDELLTTLEDNNAVTVVGASGSGKSSLVRAGLLPALEAGFLSGAGTNWRMVVMRPGNSPFSNLAASLMKAADCEQPPDPQAIAFTEATLRSGPSGLLEAIQDLNFPPGTNVLLLVDQFEEIFRFRHLRAIGEDVVDQRTTADERNEATAFVNVLLAAQAEEDPSLYGVITMRSDFLGDCDAFHGLPEVVNDCQFLVPRLRRDQLRDTITGPLNLFGARVEEGLVNRILNKVGSDPDQLPLMQHLLLRMWSREDRTEGEVVLRLTDYQAVGGLEHALSWHADEAFDELGDDASKRVAEVMFRCLCGVNAEARLTRRLVTVAEVADVAGVHGDKVKEVAKVFLHPNRSFLTKSPPADLTLDTTLDISHEALMRQWVRLANWVSHEAQSAAKYRRLSETAQLWKEDNASLLGSPELDIARDWRELEKPTQTWAKRYGGGFDLSMEFLDASIAEQEAQADRQRRESRRKTVILVATLAVVTSLMIIAAFLWWRSHEQATEINDLFVRSQLSLGTASIRNGIMNEGLLGYWTAFEKTTPGQVRRSARNLIASWSQNAGRPLIHDRPVWEVAFSCVDDTILTVTDQTAQLWSLETGQPLAVKVVADGESWQAFAVNPIDMTVLVARNDSAQIWDVRTGKPLGTPFPHGAAISAVAFSAAGSTVLTVSENNVRLWNAQTGEPYGDPLAHHDASLAALGPHGHTVFLGLGRGPDPLRPRLFNVTSRKSTEIPIPGETVYRAAFSPDGKVLLTADTDKAQLWNTETFEAQGIPLSQHGMIETIVFSPDSKLVLTGSADNTARLWDTRTGSRRGPPLQHEGTVMAAIFSADGQTILTGSADNTARLWDASTGKPLSYPLRHAGSVTSLAFSPDGRTLLTGSLGGAARLWQVPSHVSFHVMASPRAYAALDPNGDTVVLPGDDHRIDFLNLRTGTPAGDPLPAAGPPRAIDFSADGSMVLTADSDVAVLWDVKTRSKLPPEFEHGAPIEAASFGPHGETILTAGGQMARLWDRQNADRPKQEFRHQSLVVTAAISPDGKTVATGGKDRTARLWDVQSGMPVGKPLVHGDTILAVAFSPDCRLIATGSNDNTAAIWDVHTGDLLGTPLTHRDAVSDVTFSPDGTTLLTASYDTKARLWDVASGELRGDPLLHSGQVITALYHPQGRYVLTTDDDGSARFWDTVPAAADEPERLRLSIEWRSGFQIDSNKTIRRLSQAEWLQRQQQLEALGGPCDVRSWDDLTAAEQDAIAGQR